MTRRPKAALFILCLVFCLFASISALQAQMGTQTSPSSAAPATPAPAAAPAGGSGIKIGAPAPVAKVPTAHHYSENETLPIQVGLAYYKLLNRTPPYMTLLNSNKDLMEKTKGAGGDIILDQQRTELEKMFAATDPHGIILRQGMLHLKGTNPNISVVMLDGLSPDVPVLYDLSNDERYGIFIRNTPEVLHTTPPYEIGNFQWLNRMGGNVAVELTLRPLAADAKDFTLADHTTVHVILADVVELKVFDGFDRRLVLQKRFKNWQPPSAASLLTSDLLAAPEAAPKP